MDVILLDTDIFSFIFKGNNRLQPYIPHLKGKILAISFMTAAELFQWASIRKWGRRRINQLEKSLTNYLIFPCNIELCRGWGKVRALCRAGGHPISPQDAWIAATALHYELPLATHNISDFEKVKGLTLIRPET
jgi:tRNA(fMet)-specific endonuclease VapC